MVPLTLAEVVKATGGRLITQNNTKLTFTEISLDSRQVAKNSLFIALKGERYDGHDFIKQAIAAGATGVIVKDRRELPAGNSNRGVAVITVPDTKEALLRIGHLLKTKLNCVTVGITGSNGKTTVKELTANILKQKYKTYSSPLNFNNEIGLPLTLAKAQVDVEVLILELAMRGFKQIKQLAQVAEPKIGVITNIGLSHIELLGSLENIAKAKLELIESLPADGIAVLNADDDWFSYLKKHTQVKLLTYGLSKAADIRAEQVKLDSQSRPQFNLCLPDGQKGAVHLKLMGYHGVSNALAAATLAFAFNLPLKTIITGLEQEIPVKMRLELETLKNGVKVINDAYNASPASVAAALQVLANFKTDGKRYAVLGQMAELGAFTEEAHKAVGQEILKQNIDVLVTVGQTAALTAQTVEAAKAKTTVFSCKDVAESSTVLLSLIKPGDVILVKGSRVAGLERLVQKLTLEV
jgi:UDP-N-acetylmuramoyl-tripeptide--D-alanyl-D-alanine ligase